MTFIARGTWNWKTASLEIGHFTEVFFDVLDRLAASFSNQGPLLSLLQTVFGNISQLFLVSRGFSCNYIKINFNELLKESNTGIQDRIQIKYSLLTEWARMSSKISEPITSVAFSLLDDRIPWTTTRPLC
jgi:hypothetical protein